MRSPDAKRPSPVGTGPAESIALVGADVTHKVHLAAAPGPVRVIGTRRSNAELMADCARLGYLDGHVLDLTYGRGRFWKLYRPAELTTNDLDPATGAGHHYDFCSTGFDSETFDTVVFDPGYKLNGPSQGTGPASLDASYGVGGPYRSVTSKMSLIRAGIDEAVRLSRRLVLVKCQDQVVSGAVRWLTIELPMYADEAHSARLRDRLEMQSYRAQPDGTRQLHARRDHSTLLVFEVAS